jgi:hypothetical protein
MIVPLGPLLVGARAREPLSAALWSSVSLNLLVGLWMMVLVFAG